MAMVPYSVSIVLRSRDIKAIEVERDPFCTKLLSLRMRDGLLPNCSLWNDVETFDANTKCSAVGCGGGFPCQARDG